MRVIDVEHLGRPHVIGCWEVDGVLVDPGPESSLPTLLEALGDEQPRALLLTHIHLDHAAATGAMVRRWPDLEVYVHERGAPHLIDPSKLLASAERLYGDEMERLWGEIVPVPEANVRPLAGGESVLGMRVAYTPGHASHHVCYLHEDSGTAFVGDVAAVRIPPSNLIVPPTPPPDIDIEAWEESIGIVEGWQPQRLALTHFGPVEEPAEHLAIVRERLREEAQLARDLPRPSTNSATANGLRQPSTRRPPPSCSRPSRPRTSGAASIATGASAPSAKQPRRQVLAHPLDRLFDAVVGGGEGDAEEALAAGPVHRARRDDDGRLFQHLLAEGGRGVAVGNGRPDVDRALRRRHLDADLAQRRDDHEVAAAGVGLVHPLQRPARARRAAAPAICTASKRPESTLVFSRQ